MSSQQPPPPDEDGQRPAQPMQPAPSYQPGQYGQPPPGYPPPPAPPGYYPPPPKPNHTLRNVLLILGGVLILSCGGCLAFVGIAANQTDVTTQGQHSKTNTGGSGGGEKSSGGDSGGPDNSTATKDGPLTWGNWRTVSPVQVKGDPVDDYDVRFRVKNIGDAQDTGAFTVTVLKGKRILGSADCSTSSVAPGQVATVDCFSTDDFVPGWTEITIENAY